MTLSERLVYGLRSVTGPVAFLRTALRAAVNQGLDSPKEWGQGDEAFARRFGSAFAERIISQSLQQGAALALHEDNRYFRSGEHGFKRRLGYAVASSFLARHDDGARHISISGIGGVAGEAFIARAWQPRSTGSAGDAALAFGTAMATRVGINTAREFLPRVLTRLLR